VTATDKATEAVAEMAEEVAEQSLEFADAARGVDSGRLALAFGAFLFGAGVGGGLTYLLARKRLEVKYAQIAEEEIEGMREHYRAKTRALEAEAAKRPVKDLVEELGYSPAEADNTKPPMVVQPPDAVKEAAEEEAEPEVEVHNVFADHEGEVVDFEWDYQKEKRKRSPDIPYVIHYDERDEMEYQVVTLTYYEGDDVVCNERDEIIDPADRDGMFGEANLERFGHGSNDPSVVYVRNDTLELVYEVVKSPNSYSEEVHGIRHEGWNRGNLERMRRTERDDPEE